MKKLIVITIALAALLAASGASAATYIIRIGVDDDETGFVYTYNNIYEANCSETGCVDTCKNWWTNVLPFDVYGIHATVYKDNSATYNWYDWDAFDEDLIENNPDQYDSYVPASGDRAYWMSHYWDESQYYWFTEYARFDYKYYSSSPNRCRLFTVTPMIE